MSVVIGTAGWSIPRADAMAFPTEGTALERYSRVFTGVEVNSSFHRSHRASTWAKWAASTPDYFRFAVKLPKAITHQARLRDVNELISQFALEVGALGGKLGVLLVQLPPKLSFEHKLAETFFENLKQSIGGGIVCEPRHVSWFENEADALLDQYRIARVAADPALGAIAAVPGGWPGLAYWRLHGSPAMYRSSYSDEAIAAYAQDIRATTETAHDTWCIFDNTAASAATRNALSLLDRI